MPSRLARRLRHSETARLVAAHLGASYIRLVAATTRWRVEGREEFDRLLAPGTGVIAVAWHGRLFMSPLWTVPGRRSVAVISNNRDGDLIGAIVARFGAHAVRGSTRDRAKGRDKGGRDAYLGAERALMAGALVGITPDGPRGPRMRAQPGAAILSIATGAPVQPIAFSVRRGRTLRSWDRFLLPFPFGSGVQVFGEPLHPPAASDAETVAAYTARIEAALTAVTRRADTLCGREPVCPDPAAACG